MENNNAKIWFLDIENTPLLSYTWGRWEQNVIDVKEYSYILSFAAKQLEGRWVVKGLCDYPEYQKNKSNDKLLIQDLWGILDDADVIVWQNGDAFDAKKINSRFSYYGIKPPSPYKTVDTKKIAKKYFSFDSNSLDNLSQFFGFGRKEKHNGFETWLGCMNGDKKSWNIMKRYNKHDVVLLEKLYLKLLPWMNHPNVGMYKDKLSCPNCGSGKIQARGFAVTNVSKYHRYQCQNCGKWGRDTKNVNTNKLVVSI